MRGRLLGSMLLLGACSEGDAPLLLRDATSPGAHRRAVFQLRVPDDAPPAFAAYRPGLERLRTLAGERTGFRQPDLDRVRSLAIPSSWTDDDAGAWAETLDADWVVLRLAPVVPPEDLDPPTPSYVDAQGYRDALGITGDFSGAGVAIHEVEYGWRSSHEDLVDVDLHPEPGQTVAAEAFAMDLAPEHGTATVGMLVAPANGYGIDGLVPAATLHTYPEWTEEGGLRRAEAIASAISQADPGDVVVLQMQAQHPNTGQLVPAEIDPDVWMLTRMATDAGVLVVAAGGNGAFDLDGPDAADYRERGDSGAILVGAGAPEDRTPLPFSTFGGRIDLHGWGASVFTLGYGDFARLGDDDDQAYTDTFQGTSSALPMVVGAAAMLLEAFLSAEGMPPDPADVRRLLVATGRPQAEGVHVGPLPDVAEAAAAVVGREAEAPIVTIVSPASDLETVIDLGEALAVTIEVAVDDPSPIYRVELEVDGATLPIYDDAAPYAFDLSFEEGEHTLRARAVDAWGNAGWSDPRQVVAVLEEKPSGSSGEQETSGTSGEVGDSSGEAPSAGGGSGGCALAQRSERPGRSAWLGLVVIAWLRRSRRTLM